MLNYIIYRIGKFLALHLPLKIAYGLAVFLSNLHFIISTIDRRTVIANLNAIFPHQNNTHKARAVFINFGKYLVDFFRSEKIDKEYIRKKVKIENLELVDKALDMKRGVIIVTAHIGNWELGGIVMSVLGYPFNGIALPHRHERVNRFFNRQREISGEKVIPLGKAARKCLECLRNNELIALLGDRDFTPGGIIEEFLGRESLIPKGPAGFSLKTGAPIVTGFMIRQKGDTFKLIFDDLIEPYSTGDDNQDLHNITKKFLRTIERYIKQYPSQWLMFRNYWIR
jgi:KDO2-lipid IV(A) lauroyltransferase